MRILCFIIFSCSIIYCASDLAAQTIDSFEIKFNAQYEKNILLEEIDGIYIPYDIMDAMTELDRMSPPEAKAKILEGEEDIVVERLTRGLGRWMALNWNFYEGSRLSHFLREQGISYTDDMQEYLIRTYYRYLKGIELQLTERAATIKKRRDDEYQEQLKKQKVTYIKKGGE